MERWIVGCDVGGTFTDFAARELGSGRTVVHKRPSTPDDPSRAVLHGLRELTERHAINPRDITRFGHGTTVATNALLQRKGAKLAVVTTKGFRDLLEIGRQIRPSIYDLQIDPPRPLADRAHRIEVDERIDAEGRIIRPLSDDSIREVVETIRAMPEIGGVAICLIFGFLNPEHERRLAEALRAALPGLSVSVSSEVQPEFREFERFSTTTINAFLQPEVGSYMNRLREQVVDYAPDAEFGIFQSSGGLMSVTRAALFPVRTALSGPAAGAVGAAGAAQQSKTDDIITLDIGGTSTDVCLVRGGKTAIASVRDIAGFRIRLPMVDIHTVGAGGGSIAHIGPDGLMKVGPESAGAVPGPACYGHGGTRPTVSDANVILGRLPTQLTGGDMRIDREAALRVVSPLAAELGVSVEQAALGIIGIVNSNMARAIRVVSIEKGHDPRKFSLMPFGGAGGLHATDVAQAIGMRRIIVPRAPGILCAEGLILADLQEDFVHSTRVSVGDDMGSAAGEVEELAARARAWLAAEAEGAVETAMILTLDMRYVGQNYELAVELPASADTIALPPAQTLLETFFAAYRRAYGHHDAEAPVEIVNIRLRAVARLAQAQAAAATTAAGEVAPYASQQVWFSADGSVPTPLFDRNGLPPGTRLQGPAIITQLDSTTVVPPGATVIVDDASNLIMEIGNV